MILKQDQFVQLVKMVNDLTIFLKTLEKQTDFKIGLPTPKLYTITQHFGENPEIYKKWGFAGHFGTDFAAPNGSPILACDNGYIERVDFSTGNGYFVELRHDWGFSLYLHLKEKPTWGIGQQFFKGMEIGKVGNTGFVIPAPTPDKPLQGSHLHFSIIVNDIKNEPYKNFTDPENYF